jgi:hypothetical protein
MIWIESSVGNSEGFNHFTLIFDADRNLLVMNHLHKPISRASSR